MAYKSFDKKSSLLADKSVSSMGFKSEIISNQKLAEELQKPIAKKFEKQKVHSYFKDNIWDADLADVQLIRKFSKRLWFVLCVIDIYCNYTWVVPLKDKKRITIANSFQNTLDESGPKPNEIWVDKDTELYNETHGNEIHL